MSNQPNIFSFATSELTQDAFITWLLHWAAPEYKEENEYLNHLGTSFLASLLACQEIEINGNITKFHIEQQFHKIDVFITFKMQDTTYAIIIEDKVHTSEHNNQLERYKTKITELKNYDVLVPIYFKTGYQVNQSRIKEKGYHYYSLKDFLKLISKEKIAQINNDVLTQYYSYLLKKEIDYDYADNQANNYLIKPIKDWTWWTCARFFHEYKNQFKADWGEIANNRGRILGFWFGGKALTSIDRNIGIYLDIIFKNNRLHISYRIYLKENAQINKDNRNDIYHDFLPFLTNNGIETRLGKYSKAKESMLLAEITNLDGDLTYTEFVKKIELYQSVLNEYVDSRDATLAKE